MKQLVKKKMDRYQFWSRFPVGDSLRKLKG